MTISAKILRVEAAERVEADDHGGSGKTENGAGKFQQRRRLVPRDAPGDEEGEDRRRRGQHHGDRRRHILLRPGDHQKRDGRVDGLLEGKQLPCLDVGRKPEAAGVEDRKQEEGRDERAGRDEGDRRDRTEARSWSADRSNSSSTPAPAAAHNRASSAQPWDRLVATAPASVRGFHFTRLMVPEKVKSDRSPVQHAAQEDQGAAGAGDLAARLRSVRPRALHRGIRRQTRPSRPAPAAPGRRSRTGNNRRTT